MIKKILLRFLLFIIMLGATANYICSQSLGIDSILVLKPGEGWWGGLVNDSHKMPFGQQSFLYDLNIDNNGNQASSILLSDKGRYIWSERPFRFSFQNGNLVIDHAKGEVIYSTKKTLKEAYLEASSRFFPSKGLWPDSLLVTSPQYNLWIELMYNPNQKDVLNYADQVLKAGWPAGVLMIDDNWTNYYGQFDFDKAKFPNARLMMDKLHQIGFKVMVWICPFISPDSPVFRELKAKKLLLMSNGGNKDLKWSEAEKPLLINWWNGYSAHLDLTNPEAVNWLNQKLSYLKSQYGLDGFKFDAGDYESFNDSTLVSFQKVDPAEHCKAWNKIGLYWNLNEYRAAWQMGGEPLVQRLRDKGHNWADLQKLIPHSIVQQLMGYTFTCPDMIGGGEFTSFLEGSVIDQKMVVRSAQCSALMPMMQFSAAPWRILDSLHFAAVDKAVKLRQGYITYIMKVLRHSAKTGEPALRPMEYDYPEMGYSRITDQFFMGPDLMIAPVVTPSNNRDVVFPKGKWKYKQQIYKGLATKNFDVALDELLVFEKIN